MKIYVITKGSYSDYHICAVTANKEKAKQLERLFSGICDQAYIEEYDTGEFSFIKKDEKCFDVLKIKGNIEVKETNLDLYEIDNEAKVSPYYRRREDILGIKTIVIAKDEEHAIKIAQDRFAEYEAEQKGIV